MIERDVLDWLLDSDPSLRWQVERDLLGEPPEIWERTRARVATEGHGAALLSHQDADGQWAGGAFFPADVVARWNAGLPPAEEGQPFTATTWSLTSLREWGLDPAVLAGTARKLEPVVWEYEDMPYWGGEVDVCINAMTLGNGTWLGRDMSALADWFVEHQLPDGGWNCEWVEGSTRSSFHSTINAIRGLLEYEQRTGATPAIIAARRRGEQYLLERRLRYRRSNGEPLGGWTDVLMYPPRAQFTTLKALDHLTAAALHDGVPFDDRMTEAVESIRARRRPDGSWLQEHVIPGRVWFPLDVAEGEPSPWLTFHALRMLSRWDAAAPA
jgi:hypothetical protein